MRRAWLWGLWLCACTNGVGEPCAPNRPCAPSLECVTAGETEEAGVCDYPLGAFGARCESAASCAAELTCSSHFTPGERYGTCIHRQEVGAPCVVDRDCESGRCEAAPSGGASGVCGA